MATFLIHGADTYRSKKALAAIRARFLKQSGGMVDCATYDMDDTSLETLRQTFLATPFLVTHRLFILKHTFACPKAALEGILQLVQNMSPTTVVVFYEIKPADKRLSLYQWLTKNGTVMEHTIPAGAELANWTKDIAAQYKATLEPAALTLLTTHFGNDTLQLDQEIHKLSLYAHAQARSIITRDDVETLCHLVSEDSLFGLTDALRDGSLRDVITQYLNLRHREDPFLLAGTIASQIRSLAKLALAYSQGLTTPAQIASATKLNPYVVKLNLPKARQLSDAALRRCYDRLLWFDENAKNGNLPPDLGLLLLIMYLHGTLKRDSRVSA